LTRVSIIAKFELRECEGADPLSAALSLSGRTESGRMKDGMKGVVGVRLKRKKSTKLR
jgi:hypothetical protein